MMKTKKKNEIVDYHREVYDRKNEPKINFNVVRVCSDSRRVY